MRRISKRVSRTPRSRRSSINHTYFLTMHTLVKTTERTPLLLAAAALLAFLLSPGFAFAQSASAAVETGVRANVETNVSVKANAQVRATTTTNARTEISLRERATGKANEEDRKSA